MNVLDRRAPTCTSVEIYRSQQHLYRRGWFAASTLAGALRHDHTRGSSIVDTHPCRTLRAEMDQRQPRTATQRHRRPRTGK